MGTRAQWAWPAAAGLFLMAGVAHGHSLAEYASTPVSPPAGFTWLPPVAGALFMGLNTVLLVTLWKERPHQAANRSAIAAGVFGLAFYWFGRTVAHSTTVPPPGLGWGWPVLTGLAHLSGTRSLFVRWNVYGLLFLGAVLLVLLVKVRPLRVGRCGLLLAANAALYAACLLPYHRARAYTHGWAGLYVRMDCEDQVGHIGRAALRFARENDGRLPAGRTMADVFEEVRSYNTDLVNWQGRETFYCPVGGIFEADPKPYVWNADLSGVVVAELEADELTRPLIVCPYIEEHSFPVALFADDLARAYTDENAGGVYPDFGEQLDRGMPFETLDEFVKSMAGEQ